MAKSRKAYPDIGDEAVDRIKTRIDTTAKGIKEIREALKERYPAWTSKQVEGFAKAIRKDQARPTIRLPEQSLYIIKSPKTKAGGQKRTKIVRDHAGKIIGKRANIKVTTRKGNKLYIKNTKTGKKSWIKLNNKES